MSTPAVCVFRLVKTETVAVDEIVEVEVADSRPARPARASHAPQARSVAVATFSLVVSRKAFAAARLPRSKAVGKAPTLIATHRHAHAVGCRQEPTNAPSLRWASRATAQLPCRDGMEVHGGRSDYNTS